MSGLRTALGAREPTVYRHWRAVQKLWCLRCDAPIWAGYDNDEVAVRAVVEFGVFLTHDGERAAILDDLETWAWSRGPQRIQWRTPWHRRALRAGPSMLVVVQHRCGRSIPARHQYEPPRAIRQTKIQPAEPPF